MSFLEFSRLATSLFAPLPMPLLPESTADDAAQGTRAAPVTMERDWDVLRDARGRPIPDDMPVAANQGAGDRRRLCLVVVDRSLYRGQQIGRQLPPTAASVIVAASPDQLTAILEYAQADAVVLTASDHADALQMLPAVQAPLVGSRRAVPLLCQIHGHNNRRSLRPLLLRLGASAVIDAGAPVDELLDSARAAAALVRLARRDGAHTMLQQLVDAAPHAQLFYDAAWTPLACNRDAWQYVQRASGGRCDARSDHFLALFSTTERHRVDALVTELTRAADTTAHTLRALLGAAVFSQQATQLHIERLTIEEHDVFAVRLMPDVPPDRGPDALRANGIATALRALAAVTDTMQRAVESRRAPSTDAPSAIASSAIASSAIASHDGIDDDALLAELRGLLALLGALQPVRLEETAQLLSLDAVVAPHVAALSAALSSTWQVEWHASPRAVVVRSKPDGIRRVLTLMVLAARQAAAQRQLVVRLDHADGNSDGHAEGSATLSVAFSAAQSTRDASSATDERLGPVTAADLEEIGQWARAIDARLVMRHDDHGRTVLCLQLDSASASTTTPTG